MNERLTSMQVSANFRDRIKQQKRSGESYEAYFERILTENEYLKKLVEAKK
jgi:2-phosphoglycerate kinase